MSKFRKKIKQPRFKGGPKRPVSPIPESVSLPAKPIDEKKKSNVFIKSIKKYWPVVVAIGVVFTMIKNWPDVVAAFSSDKKNFEKNTIIKGTLNGTPIDDSFAWNIEKPMVFYSNPLPPQDPVIRGVRIPQYDDPEFIKTGKISVKIGGLMAQTAAKVFLYPQDFLRFLYKDCNLTKSLLIGVRDSRMYVSTEFNDLQHEDAMGIIEYNHWKLYKGNILEYYDTDSSLEVKDKQGYIVFSIKYFTEHTPNRAAVEISGYLIDPNSILIMGNQLMVVDTIGGAHYTDSARRCFSKDLTDWRRKAEVEIAKIKTIME